MWFAAPVDVGQELLGDMCEIENQYLKPSTRSRSTLPPPPLKIKPHEDYVRAANPKFPGEHEREMSSCSI